MITKHYSEKIFSIGKSNLTWNDQKNFNKHYPFQVLKILDPSFG